MFIIGACLIFLPFTKRASVLPRRQKAAFLLAGALAVTWVLLGVFMTFAFLRNVPRLEILLNTIKTVIGGAGAGTLLTMYLCGCFDFLDRSSR